MRLDVEGVQQKSQSTMNLSAILMKSYSQGPIQSFSRPLYPGEHPVFLALWLHLIFNDRIQRAVIEAIEILLPLPSTGILLDLVFGGRVYESKGVLYRDACDWLSASWGYQPRIPQPRSSRSTAIPQQLDFMSSTSAAFNRESSSSSSPIEKNLNLPDYAQDVLEDVDLPVLLLISHGHAPPLNPRPKLRFDLRSLPNPPKYIRDAYNGTSKRLQEWMRADERFDARRDNIRKAIEGEMKRITEEHEKRDVLKIERDEDEEETKIRKLQGVQGQEEEGEEEDSSSEEEDSGSGDMDKDHSSTFRVGIYCAMGRHRSVAMVEELANMSWPGWRVEVQHRDLNKKRGSGKKYGGKESRGARGGGISSHFEDD